MKPAWAKPHTQSFGYSLSAALMFTLSLLARTVDLHLCGVWPIGTHFLWHLLNGAMIALLLQGLVRIKRVVR